MLKGFVVWDENLWGWCLTVRSWLRDMMRPVTSSIDGAETSSAEDGVLGPTPLPSRQLVAGAAYLASTLSAQVTVRVHTG